MPASPFRRPSSYFAPCPLALAILGALSATAQAQTPAPAMERPLDTATQVTLGYADAASQVGVGVDRDLNLHGEARHVLNESATSALIAQAWLGRRAGGLRLDYNWIGDKEGKADADTLVRKLFLAWDRNAENDRKATLGFGLESEVWFGSAYLSRGLSGKRYDGAPLIDVDTMVVEGSEAGRPYRDTTVTTTSTQFFNHVYERGLGLRLGALLDEPQLRLTAGYDRERGEFHARQTTWSLGAEKFWRGSPHSVGLALERYKKSGDYDDGQDGTRALLTYRYTFGATPHASSAGWRETRITRQVQVPATEAEVRTAPSAPIAQSRKEQRIVKTTATMTSDAFFELNKALLTELARRELDQVAQVLKTSEYQGAIRIVGHTCDLGSDAYNLKLSLRRAAAVRDYLVAQGLPRNALLVEGLGESQPKFANTKDERHRNRRVEIEFVQIRSRREEIEIPIQTETRAATPTPAVTWVTEEVAAEPVWVRRALRHTVPHKQTVDSYRGADIAQSSSTSRAWLNRAPLAAADSYTVVAGVAQTLDVLANDSDPDGNALSIAAVATPAHGTVAIEGNRLRYTPQADFAGSDSFSYTVSDGAGGSANAQVSITVQRPNRAPLAVDDRYVVGGFSRNTLNVLANDSDPDGNSLSIASFTQPAFGTITREGNVLVYQGNGFFTATTFSYTISDGAGGTATATVTLIDP